jgi:hypothetical protein
MWFAAAAVLSGAAAVVVILWRERRDSRLGRTAGDAFRAKGYAALAEYNAECARGLVHTPERDAEMAEMQRRLNEDLTLRLPIE